jgi:uncharacterized membrane protein YobD (UPF0266 family)
MKTKITLLLMVILLASFFIPFSKGDSLIYSYDGSGGIGMSSATAYYGNQFIFKDDYNGVTVAYELEKIGSPQGFLAIKVYTVGNISNFNQFIYESSAVAMSTLSGVSFCNFTFSTDKIFYKNTCYYFALIVKNYTTYNPPTNYFIIDGNIGVNTYTSTINSNLGWGFVIDQQTRSFKAYGNLYVSPTPTPTATPTPGPTQNPDLTLSEDDLMLYILLTGVLFSIGSLTLYRKQKKS